MSSESYFIILVFALLLAKFILSKNKLESIKETYKKLISKSAIPGIIYFTLTVISTLLVSNQVIGIVVIFSTAWVLFYNYMRQIGHKFSAWWALTLFIAYMSATYLGFEKNPKEDIWFLLLFSWGFTFINVLVFDVMKKIPSIIPIILTSLLSICLFLIPLTYISYFLTFDIPLTEDQLNAIFQTTISESGEFFSQNSSILNIINILIFILFPVGLLIIQGRSILRKFVTNQFIVFSVTILFIVSLNTTPHIRVIELIINTFEEYHVELIEFKKELEKRKTGEINFSATKENSKELYIVIIGESHNKNHMGLYGYHRNTTPRLSKMKKNGDLIVFNQSYSNHVHTVPTLTLSLTEANQKNGNKFNHSLSIIDIQDASGFDTYWISNQVAYGGWDNPVSVLADRANHRFNLNKNLGLNINTSVYDIQLVQKLESILSQPITQNTVIYLHLMGNHGGYSQRYPKEFNIYKEPFERKDFGSKKYWADNINAYDNSVLYNDYVVSQIIEVSKKYNGTTACLYFADHSEDVLGKNGHDHGNFNFSMIQTPMMLWVSDKYKGLYPEKIKNINRNKNKIFSNGQIYDFLIGLEGIKTNHYDSLLDLSSENYSNPVEHCYTLHKAHKFNESENFFYFEKSNILAIKSRGELSRVYPHRVNTKGKLSTILYDRCTSFELDLVFRENGDSSYLEVGHGENEMSGMSFEELLNFSTNYEISKIWLDIKNVNKSNVSKVLSHLVMLSEKFDLKNKVIVESSMTDASFSILAENGFHTSYYLPTHIKDYDEIAKENVAKEIAFQIKRQNISAVSFDYELYPFVKNHLEKKINQDIVYHTWNISFGFQDPNLIEKLDNSTYYHDQRIKSILVKYKSNFEL